MSSKNLNHNISGVYTAIVTPFKNGEVDYVAFSKLCELQVLAGIDGIVISGTTGESPTLSDAEKIELIKRTKQEFGSQVKIMGGSGNNNTAASIELSQQMAEAGADSLLVVTPPYNKPSLAGLQAHFRAIGAATPLPVCLYHVPGRTGQRLDAAALATLCAIDQVVAVKEASADLSLFSEANQLSQANYLSGDDFTYLPSLAVGGVGVISVLTNVFPKAFVVMHKLAQSGDLAEARKIHAAVFDFTQTLFIESNPCPTKYILAEMGLCANELRLPLVAVTAASGRRISESFTKTKVALANLGVL